MIYKIHEFEDVHENACYDSFYLYEDMENMGFLFEYGGRYGLKLFGVKIHPIDFINAFMISTCRRTMECGNTTMLCEAAEDTFERFIRVDCAGDIQQFVRPLKQGFYDNQLYWCGEMYAYMHFRSKLSSRKLIERFPIRELLLDYTCGHEMSEEAYYAHVEKTILGFDKPKRRVFDSKDRQFVLSE